MLVVACCAVSACGGSSVDRPAPSTDSTRRPTSGGTPGALTPGVAAGDLPGTDRTDDAALIDASTRAAWARLRWPGGDVVDSNKAERLDEPILAGSLFKLVAARAALEQGIVSDDTRIACPRALVVRGRRVDCVHPDLGRPLTLDEAIAHSCNHFFVTLAGRLDRHGLASTLRRLSHGAVTLGAEAPMPLVVLGLDGPRVSARAWASTALAAMADNASTPQASLVRRGVVAAASTGTAVGLRDPSSLTLAKTATTIGAQGGQEGVVVAWRPERHEAIVVRAPGVAGRDAARIARAIWDDVERHDDAHVRVGRVRTMAPDTSGPAVDDVPIETYVAGVVAAEGTHDMPAVAQQALAILARSYVRASPGRHARDGYDVCDSTHCQVFGASTTWSRDAAAVTRGVVLTERGTTVAVPYSASCSGILVSPRDVWGGEAAARTRTGVDPGAHAVETWRSDVASVALTRALQDAGHRGDQLRDLRVAAYAADGVPSRLALDGLVPSEIDATTFRHIVGRRIGWDVLKSHAWAVTRTARGYRFSGRGKGHGAGVCLRGASTLAADGVSVDRVLAAYAPDAVLRAEQDRLTLRLPAARASEGSLLRQTLLTHLAGVRVRLAVTTSRAVEVVVHPTREAYQRTTGRAWWTAANARAVRDGRWRVDLAPPPSMGTGTDGARAGEAFFTTWRHEVVHILTSEALTDAPLWMSEGLAHLVARPLGEGHALSHEVHGGGTLGRQSDACPTDEELRRPGSLDAMRQVYAAAAACAAAALPAGVAGWRTLLHPR